MRRCLNQGGYASVGGGKVEDMVWADGGRVGVEMCVGGVCESGREAEELEAH